MACRVFVLDDEEPLAEEGREELERSGFRVSIATTLSGALALAEAIPFDLGIAMDQGEIFDSAVRSAGDLAGVFECDGETCYFYLYATEGEDGARVLDSIHVLSGEPDFGQDDISIRWNSTEDKVGLFIRDVLWAVFDTLSRCRYGGDYAPGASSPRIPWAFAGDF